MITINGKAFETVQSDGHIYNADTGLRKWRAALAKLKAGEDAIYNVVVLGDSNSEGYGVSATPADYTTKGYPGLLRTELATMFGDLGYGMLAPYHPYGAPYWTPGGWQLNTTLGWGPCKTSIITATLDTSCTFAFTGTGLIALYGKGSGCCKFTWKIDEGSETTVDAYSGTMDVGVLTITGLTAGAHTLTLKNIAHESYPAATSQFFFGACPTNATTAGVRVHNLSKYGNPVASFVSESATVNTPQMNYWTPILTIIATIGIDANAGTNLSTYQTSLQSLITKAKVYVDVLLFNNAALPNLPDVTANAYGDVMKNLAYINNCAYADYVGRQVTNTDMIDLGLIRSDDEVHFTAAGQQDIATFLSGILLNK